MGFIIENNYVESMYGFLLIFWLVYLYFVKDYGHWEEVGVAHVPAIFPLGSLPWLVLNFWTWREASTKVYNQFPNDRFVGFFYVTEPCLLIRDPGLIKLFLETDFEHFSDRVVFKINPKDYMANNMYNTGGSKWKRIRTKMTPAYTAAKMEMMFSLVRTSSDGLFQAIDSLPGEVKVIDTSDLLTRFTIDIIAKCAFGCDINSIKHQHCEFYGAVKRSCYSWSRLLKIIALKSFPIFAKYHFFDFFDQETKSFFTTLIANTIEYRENNNIEHCDFLGLMMKLRKNQSIDEENLAHSESFSDMNEGLTVEEITAEMHLFIFMGYMTTADTCMFCLYELARHKEVQQKLFEEVDSVLGLGQSRQVDLTYQALQQMTYMDQVINEVMRLYPVFPFIIRNCTKTYTVPHSTVVIRKGMAVYIPVNGLHHDPNYFPEPDHFDPERFSPDNYKALKPFTFLPFGAGPRTCIGFRFGLMLIKSALSSIVSRYVVDLAPGTEYPLTFNRTAFNTVPDKPLNLRLTPRPNTVQGA